MDRNETPTPTFADWGKSLSARRAWIEISPKLEIGLSSSVALRKENVDRNSRTAASTFSKTVALRKESVDRNDPVLHLLFGAVWSLSARRAWIEITDMGDFNGRVYVALRKESVDRNTRPPNRQQQRPVALRKESVDRNLVIHIRVCAGHNVALRKESMECFSF